MEGGPILAKVSRSGKFHFDLRCDAEETSRKESGTCNGGRGASPQIECALLFGYSANAVYGIGIVAPLVER
eukprot:664814-Ditylum_brightwellii.AAC.2